MGEIADQLIEEEMQGFLWDFDYKEERKEKKKRNYDFSVNLLKEKWVKFKISGPSHVILENFDFYPSTWLFINKKTKKKGRGIFNLLKLV